MKADTTRKLVGVSGDDPGNRYRFLFNALSQLYPVEFRPVEPPGGVDLDGMIILDGKVEDGLKAADRGTPSYVVMGGPDEESKRARADVRLGDSPLVEACLRGQVMPETDSAGLLRLAVQPGDEVLASREGHPVWLSRTAGGGVCVMVGSAPPQVREGGFVYRHLNGSRWLRLLPLMNFLRQLTREVDWQSPPSRACFVFDDPSLYWPSYGYLDYRRLGEHARRHNYVVAIATIPIDAWWVKGSVASIFRSFSPRLSLLIHGNNHTSRELLHEEPGTTGLAAVAQALGRMERLEHRHGLAVSRIMVAPHGAIANHLFPHLLKLGYDAALVTTHLLVQHNSTESWPATFGLNKSEIVGGGLPVIPRIRLSREWKNDVLFAAFLRQPIVIAGHHQDAARKLELLERIGKTVNGLPGASWSDMRDILQSNYLQRVDGDGLRIRMYSRRVVVPVPPGVRRLWVERTWVKPDSTEKLVVKSARDAVFDGETGATAGPLALNGAEEIEVVSQVANPVHFSTVARPAVHPWSITRKILMETRDRIAPVLPFALRRRFWIDNSP